MRYVVGDGFIMPPVTLEVPEDTPPCMYCRTPVASPSMNGPLVCVNCDLGRIQEGDGYRKMVLADYGHWGKARDAYIKKYRVKDDG